jgi:hypothetical protein
VNGVPLRFPVTCPKCGRESLVEFPLVQIADAILNSRRIRLTNPCHGETWNASEIELQQICEYLEAVCLDQRKTSVTGLGLSWPSGDRDGIEGIA